MIIGTGIDIVEIKRIEKAIKRWGEHFLNHVFCAEELEYAKKNKYPNQHLAARFAAKEAIFKAIGTDPAVNWLDIKIINDDHGRPIVEYSKENFNHKILLSLSHSKKYAVANAIITTE